MHLDQRVGGKCPHSALGPSAPQLPHGLVSWCLVVWTIPISPPISPPVSALIPSTLVPSPATGPVCWLPIKHAMTCVPFLNYSCSFAFSGVLFPPPRSGEVLHLHCIWPGYPCLFSAVFPCLQLDSLTASLQGQFMLWCAGLFVGPLAL